jgi:trimeric autotransporter adhesin
MTTPLRQFILKRGNTAVSSVYTGPAGEITYDTGLNAVRIHDGITPGGNLMPSGTLISVFQSNITALESNVSVLFANAATQAGLITALENAASTSGPTPPAGATEGALWYDSTGGRLYVNYDGFWVDASPEDVYTLPTASNIVLGGVKVGDNLSIDGAGVLSALPPTNLGNLTVNNQTISGTVSNLDITLAPAGTGFVSVPKLRIPVGTLIQGTAPISVTIANLTLNTLLDYSTSSSDNLVTGDYDLPNGVSGAGTGWAVYEFTTNPSPVLEIGDHIAGVGVPFLSNVIHIGTGPNANVIITDQTITATPPVNGEIIYTTRDVVNAGLNITTTGNTDISLIPGTGGHIVTTTDIIPFANDVYNLGTPAKRFKQLWLGAGTIYILDETLGTDQAIGARDGNIYMVGGTGLSAGEFTFYDNNIIIKNGARDINIGTIGATANVVFNRSITINDSTGREMFHTDRTGRTQFRPPAIPANDIGAVSIIGSTGGAYQPVVNSGGMLHITGNDGAVSRITNDAFGTGAFPAYISRAGRGTTAAPSAIQLGDILSRLSTVGWGTTNFVSPATPAATNIEVYARENFTDTAGGTEYRFYTAPVGSATKSLSVTINDAGLSLVNTANVSAGVRFRDNTLQTTAWQGDTSLVTVNANIAAANVNIATLFANAATQATALNTLTANAATQSGDITTLFANAAAQSQDITTLFANAATQSQDITTLFANAATQATALNTLTANAATQSADITALVANAASQQTQINSAVTTVNAGYAVSVNRVNGTVGIDNLGVNTIAGTANRILVNGGTAAANASVTLSLPQDINTNSTVTFSNLTITGNLTVVGNIISAGANALDSKILYLANTATAASQLDGGGIVLGNVNAAFARSILYDFNNDAWDTGSAGLTTLVLNASDGNFSGNLVSNGRASFGGTHFVFEYPNAEVQIDSDLNSYSQVVSQNHNSGTLASTDWVAVNDIGDDSNYYIDLGINSSTYVNPAYSIDGPNGGYLYINGGNLSIGTQTAGNVIKFHTSGTLGSDLRVTIDDAGITSVGNVTAQYFVGSGRYLTDLYSNANVTAYLTTDSNVLAIWNNITTLYSNAATQDSAISALRANITAANVRIQTIDSNLGTATTNITTLFSNAGVQADEINALRANITAANSAIVTANSAVVSYVNTLNTAQAANTTAINLQISNTSVAVFANAASQQTAIDALRANITAANVNISALQSNTGVLANNINILFANSAAQEDSISALRANITAANVRIQTIDANLGTVNTNITTLFANAGTQQTEINSLRANITAANSAIVTANSAVVSYVNSLNTAMAANVNAANAAIVTANTGMKSYVDTALTSANLYSFGHFAVTGQSTVDATTSNDTANLIAGTGITITTSGKQITFALDTGAGVTSLYGANNIVLSDSTGNITIQRINGIQSVVTGNSAASVNLSLTDQYFGTTRSSTGTGTVTLPAGSSVPVGRQYIIKDEGGSSGSFLRRITVAASGSDTIDGSATRGITSNYGSLTVLWTGTRWSVI